MRRSFGFFARRQQRLSRLRQLLALALLAAAVVVAAIYLVQRRAERRAEANPALAVPALGLQIKRSAHGLTISKDVKGKPQFRLFASQAEQLRPGVSDVLHRVRIVVYNRDGLYADELSGREFGYNELSGVVTARGPVHIILHVRAGRAASNGGSSEMPRAGRGSSAGQRSSASERPTGAAQSKSGRATSAGLQSDGAPIEVEARDLSFNIKSGTGAIAQGVRFLYLNARGQAGSATIDSHAGVLSLAGGVRVDWQRPGLPDLIITSGEASVQRLHPSSGRMAASAGAKSRRAALAAHDAALITLARDARITAGAQSLSADRLEFYMRANNTLRRLDALGHLQAVDRAADPHAASGADLIRAAARSARAEFTPVGLHQAAIERLLLTGGVVLDQTTAPVAPTRPAGASQAKTGRTAPQPNRLTAGSVAFLFNPRHQLTRLQARHHARLILSNARPLNSIPATGSGPRPGSGSVQAPEIDFLFAPARRAAASPAGASARLTAVEATAAHRPGARALIEMSSASGPVQAAADRFHLDLTPAQQPARMIASGNVFVRQQTAGELRSSHSDRLLLTFTPAAPDRAGALAEAIESGRVLIAQGDRSLAADKVVYDPGARRAVFTADPASSFSHGQARGADPDTRFSAPRIVWTTQPGGVTRVLAGGGVVLSRGTASAATPVVVTARQLDWVQPSTHPVSADPFTTASSPGTKGRATAAEIAAALPVGVPGTATFTGQVRLLQSPNLLLAHRLVLDGARQTLVATGGVRASFVAARALALPLPVKSQAGPMPIGISAARLRYSAATRLAVFRDQVVLRAAAAILTAPRLQVTLTTSFAGPGRPAAIGVAGLQSALATGGVRITEPGRLATAGQAEFDFPRRLATLTGGPPSIFDAEHGRISGDPLTFSLANDEIQVGSKSGIRASGETAVRK